MSYKIQFTKSAEKDFNSITSHRLKQRIVNALDLIAEDPYHTGKPLKEPLSDYYSFRISNYRIIYTIEKKKITVLVMRIRHRRDVYR